MIMQISKATASGIAAFVLVISHIAVASTIYENEIREVPLPGSVKFKNCWESIPFPCRVTHKLPKKFFGKYEDLALWDSYIVLNNDGTGKMAQQREIYRQGQGTSYTYDGAEVKEFEWGVLA